MYDMNENYALYKHKHYPLLFLKVIEDAPGIGLFDIFLTTRIANSLEDGFNQFNPEITPIEKDLEVVKTFDYLMEIEVFHMGVSLEKKLFAFDLEELDEIIEKLSNNYTFNVLELRNKKLQDCSNILQENYPELIF